MDEFFPGDSVLIKQPSEEIIAGTILYKMPKRSNDSLTFYAVWAGQDGPTGTIIVGVIEEDIQLLRRYEPIPAFIPNGSLVFARLKTIQGIGTVSGQRVIGPFGWPRREYFVTFNKKLTCAIDDRNALIVLRYPQLPIRQPIQSALKAVLTRIRK